MTDEYERSQTISTVEVSWTIDGDNLRMALSAPCTGYISVGFDPENRKEGGNYIIGYVADGEAVVRDHVGTRGNLHDADTDLGGTDNILAFAGTEIDGQTTLEFIIPLDSGDDFDRPLVPGNKHVILVAFQNTRDDLISIHSRHGVAQVDL
jgi:DOMON domain-containing protein